MDIAWGSEEFATRLQAQYLGASIPKTAVCIGVFDGVHCGHQALIKTTVAHAKAKGLLAVAMTFWPHPKRVLAKCGGSEPLPDLEPLPARMDHLAQAGVDWVIVQPFTQELCRQSPEDFIHQRLCGHLGAKRVVVGWNFAFGARQKGTPKLLQQVGIAHDFGVDVIPAVLQDQKTVSSTAIREALLAGDIPLASQMLARMPRCAGIVIPGARRGRALGFPTANIQILGWCAPAPGVYAAWFAPSCVGPYNLQANGKPQDLPAPMPAIVHMGHKPTFETSARGDAGIQTQTVAEAHVLANPQSIDMNFYGKAITLHWLCKIRTTQKFTTQQALKTQIAQDIQAAQSHFA